MTHAAHYPRNNNTGPLWGCLLLIVLLFLFVLGMGCAHTRPGSPGTPVRLGCGCLLLKAEDGKIHLSRWPGCYDIHPQYLTGPWQRDTTQARAQRLGPSRDSAPDTFVPLYIMVDDDRYYQDTMEIIYAYDTIHVAILYVRRDFVGQMPVRGLQLRFAYMERRFINGWEDGTYGRFFSSRFPKDGSEELDPKDVLDYWEMRTK